MKDRMFAKMDFLCNKNKPLLGGIITAAYVRAVDDVSVMIKWGNENIISNNGENFPYETSNDVSRFIARNFNTSKVYGQTLLERTEIDSWLTFSLGQLSSRNDFLGAVQYLDRVLGPRTYLVGSSPSIADFVVFSTLYVSKSWQELSVSAKNVSRWYNFIKSMAIVSQTLKSLPPEAALALCPSSSNRQVSQRAQEGKFVELPGAEMGKVIVRFPPEASGYLHIGHAKAALLNQYYQQAFEGKLIMRFDDTNPAKENADFEKVILEDVEMLEIKPDLFTHTSQYFDLMIEYCEKLLKEGKAYADDTDPEIMKQEREQKVESSNRNNSFEKNFALWQEMKKGTESGQKCCIRAKIDMSSLNGCLRDPTIYRCKNEIHPRTGDKYKVYPTYDFACPIVDSIEGVTHVLRTMEYHDRDPQFYWFIEALGLRKPHIWEYSRLSMTHTVLSKRKLTWFVQQKLVDGWDDPRLPTVRGVLRRGMTVEGLKQFIIAQGSSRSVVFMEWDKIWAINKKVIDPIAPRYTVVEHDSSVPVHIAGVQEQHLSVPKHPKNDSLGFKEVWIGPHVLIDRADAEQLRENENATFINWGNIRIKKINREQNEVVSIEAEPNVEDKNYKNTLKLTWLAVTQNAPFIPTWCVYFDHIITKPLLSKDEDFKQFINTNTRVEVQMFGDPELKKLAKGDIIQLQRRGFFRVDVAYQPRNLHSGTETAIALFYVPDGTKDAGIVNRSGQTRENKSETAIDASKSGDKVAQKASQKKNVASNACLLRKELSSLTDVGSLLDQIASVGAKIRNLKSDKAPKAVIDAEVKVLLDLKGQYKKLTGTDWTPSTVVSTTATNKTDAPAVSDILNKIKLQGDTVRKLKEEKAGEALVDAAVKTLLDLKAEYKKTTGTDWTPSAVASNAVAGKNDTTAVANDLLNKIKLQGENVRKLKEEKASKPVVDAEVKVLLDLKGQYKKVTGTDWSPSLASSNATDAKAEVTPVVSELLSKITLQGDKVRTLKNDKADKIVIEAEVKALLQLKADYKAATGVDWKPDLVIKNKDEVTKNPVPVLDEVGKIVAQINEQGNIVRELKASNAEKEKISTAVAQLLALKTQYEKVTGKTFVAPNQKSSKEKKKAPKDTVSKQKVAEKAPKTNEVTDEGGVKKQTRLGLEVQKEDNLSEWYSEVITKGELIDYYDVSGCYILRPWAYAIWENIQRWFDAEIKKLDVKNCYFPIFVSKNVLEKEKIHIADFAPEVAWVTKSGDSDLAEPIAVRPTSETVMYPAYAKWIRSYRDLPIKLNQWNNVVRWEFKHPQPFIRTREFLWQEGHTAYATKEEANEEVRTILELYARIYTDLLAIPVVRGKKTEKEKFAGGDYTLTTEAFVSASGRAIQGATSHHLGQNFSKMFEIVFEDPKTREKEYVYQNSWGITTRTIGVMILIHADNRGLVLPPRVADLQVVLVPCGVTVGLSDADNEKLRSSCALFEASLKSAGFRVEFDDRMNYSPGWKFNHWELKGVPIRVEIGPKDIEKNQIVAVRRDTGEKISIPRTSAVVALRKLLDDIQQNLYERAENDLKSNMVLLKDWSSFSSILDQKKIILAPFCGNTSCEDKIKADSARDDDMDPGAPSMGAKSLCIPLEQPAEITPKDKCIHPSCKNSPLYYTLFGRSY